MINEFHKCSTLCVSTALGFALAAPVFAQSTATAPAESEITALDEIIVTARRKDESLQDVPTTVNAVTGQDLQELNIRKFEDIASVVPGLSMSTNANGIGATASVRGVNYDVNASGSNGTIEFYLNDAPISAGNLFQTMYDIQQVELLRGPQGTLRGRASPSGSMTVTTRRPDLQEIGGYVSGLLSLYGDSQNDPANSVDDYDGYELLNLYLGIRGGDGAWEVSIYGKNVTETERVLARSSTTMTTNYNIGSASQVGVSNYYGGSATTGLSMTPPREFGLSLRYAFGSK